MTAKTFITLTVLLSLSTVFTGCVDTGGTVVQTNHDSGISVIETDNTRLAHRVKVEGIKYDTVNSLKRVHITLSSTRHKRTDVDYRICWFDANGMEIDGDTKPYRNLILEGRDSVTVTGVANSPEAKTSKLRIRETSQAE